MEVHTIPKLGQGSDKPLILFFILSFALFWVLVCSVVTLQKYELITASLPLEPFFILGAWTPNVAAFLVLGLVIKKKDGIKNLILGWAKWRVKSFWYLVAFSPVFISLMAIGLYWLIYGVAPVTAVFSNPAQLVMLLPLLLLTGATGEQLGWRGFALPWLQTRMSALASSIVLGFIWSFWHIPLWFTGTGLETFPFWAYTVIAVSFSVLVTWACNNTRGSMIIASLSHLFLNVALSLIRHEAVPFIALIFAIYALIIVVYYGPGKLSREDVVPINLQSKAWL